MKYAEPSIEAAVVALEQQGVTDVVALSMTPYRSQVSRDAYELEAQEVITRHRSPLRLHPVPDWFGEPAYIEGLVARLEETLAVVPVQERQAVPVVFTAHSLPLMMVAGGDPYVQQIESTIRAIETLRGPLNWRIGFQSRSLASREAWLEPVVESVLDQLRMQGDRRVVVWPLGFVSDHMETRYDNDILHQQHAQRIGLQFHRVACLNDSPYLIAALADVLERTVAGA